MMKKLLVITVAVILMIPQQGLCLRPTARTLEKHDLHKKHIEAYEGLKGLVYELGNIMLQYREGIREMATQEKPDATLVTEADMAVQEKIVEYINGLFSEQLIIAEENFTNKTAEETRIILEQIKSTEYVWIIDPIDGTNPFVEGSDYYCTGIALFRKGRPIFSIVYSPEFDIDSTGSSLFEANEWTEGAFLNGKRIYASNVTDSELLKSRRGIIYKSPHVAERIFEKEFSTFLDASVEEKFLSSLLRILCIACTGTHDFHMLYTRPHPKLWDVLQAAYILEKAGGKITDNEGESLFPLKPEHYEVGGSGEPRLPSIVSGTTPVVEMCLSLIKGTFVQERTLSEIELEVLINSAA